MNKYQRAEQLRYALQMFAASLSEEQALEISTVYPAWVVGKNYVMGEYLTYGENAVGDPQLYKVVQAHTSQADWTPDQTPALWVRVSLEEFPEWVQPTGGHDAYNTGDKVIHNGVKYVSDVDANVWEPGVHGWSEYVE